VTGGRDTRVPLAALIAARPGCRPRLIFRTHRARRGDTRKGLTVTDCARFPDAAHQQPGGPVVLVWDGLNTHASRAMRELTAARDWLTVFQLPAYAGAESGPAGLARPETVTGQPCQAGHRPADRAGEDPAPADAVQARPPGGFLAKPGPDLAPLGNPHN
jgi:putative transposase